MDSFQSIDKDDQRAEEIGEFKGVFLGQSYVDAAEEELGSEISIVSQRVATRKSESHKVRFSDKLFHVE